MILTYPNADVDVDSSEGEADSNFDPALQRHVTPRMHEARPAHAPSQPIGCLLPHVTGIARLHLT